MTVIAIIKAGQRGTADENGSRCRSWPERPTGACIPIPSMPGCCFP